MNFTLYVRCDFADVIKLFRIIQVAPNVIIGVLEAEGEGYIVTADTEIGVTCLKDGGRGCKPRNTGSH